MENTPRVSVIIAAYNVESYIDQAVLSALTQTVTDIEVIVVDDASTDKTASVVQGLTDERVIFIQNLSNKGPSFCRNQGVKKARGDWIAILDADDWWGPERLEVLLDVARKENAHIVCDDLYLIEDGAKEPWNTYLKSREKVIGAVSHVTDVTPTKMVDDDYGILQPIIRRDFLSHTRIEYEEHLWFAEDYVFLLDCLVQGAKMVICPKAYYYYRSRVGSLTTMTLANTQSQYDLLLHLSTGERYQRFPEVINALNSRLKRLSVALQDIRVRDMFRQRRFFTAVSIIVHTPALLMNYARRLKGNLAKG